MEIYINKMESLAKKGFLCEIVTDGWANWKFNKSGKPIVETATPSGRGFGWRGCYWFFDKKGSLWHDDVGCFGNLKECIESLFETYESFKDRIDPDGFATNEDFITF